MCVVTIRTGLISLRQSIWWVTCLGLLKNECFPIYLLWNTINVCWYHQNRACFSETIDLRGHMPWFTWKWMFSHPSPEKPHKCVLKPSEQGSFFLDNWFEGLHASVYWKNAHFPINLLWNTINVCWNPQHRACFSETINLRGHMPQFTLKMNVFPSLSLEMSEICVVTIRTGLIFLRQSIWGVTCLGLLENACFPIYLFRIIRNVCWNHQNRACFSERIDLRGDMPRFTWKWMFSHPSPEQPHKCVLKPSEQGSFFLDNWFEGSHASVYWKNAHFPINLLWNTINVCWNPQHRACFSETIDLRGHMPRFTLKMNVFPSISLEMPEMCVLTIRTGLVFLRQSIWGVTCLGLL